MKIVTASTFEQQEYVKEKITYFFDSLFPFFFSKNYAIDLENFGVLSIEGVEEYSLKEILEVTAALQTLQSLLECISDRVGDPKHSKQFDRNTKILEKHSIYFPLRYDDFLSTSDKEALSLMGKPENQWIL
ncbi:hypothetical protein N780_12120 [Pontibacillus chungwhensis BH030062]|uniref:YhcU n=1 Tax=Pontibacillus chungwhensis BH030062 TaxID=1385513 RepID=A0A0A2UYE6_9BACI|nr:DUF5365 family protein [Pontibacillus chungwhensis]KGP93292.1 hypothetical protein N780_12120 [Pontibacillus chungwhensis BH030062]